MDSTFEKIRGFLAEQLGVDASQITMDSDLLNDFEADSLDIVDMVMTLEGRVWHRGARRRHREPAHRGRRGPLCGQPAGLMRRRHCPGAAALCPDAPACGGRRALPRGGRQVWIF